MYAIVAIGGNQYKVSPGDMVSVDRLAGKVGDKVNFPALLTADGAKTLVGKEAAKTSIATTIVSHGRGEKVDILRFKAKVRYHRRKGFRAALTTLKIEAIGDKKHEPRVAPAKTITKRATKKPTKK